MAQFNYDLVIIGAGPGGYVAAIRAGQLGLKTAIIEKDKLGGVCLNIGCIPSKALIHCAEVFLSQRELQEFGVTCDTSSFDYQKVFEKSRKAADTLSKGVGFLLKKNNVEVISGTARLTGRNEIIVNGQNKITFANCIIATGSRPKTIAGFEFDEETILSSTGGLMLTKLPKSLLILGGGAIGVEFAHIMNAFGVEVTIVEMMDRLLPLEDEEVTEVLRRSFKKRGINVLPSTRAVSVTKTASGAQVVLETVGEGQKTVSAEKVLMVAGRTPNTENIGLEQLGISTEKGYIIVGDYGQTSVDTIYAIGDVVPTPLLAHVASKEGEIAVEHIAKKEPRHKKIDPTLIPGAVYCEPQIASFGLTEKKAEALGLSFKKATFPYRGAGKSVAVNQPEGLVKIIFDSNSNEILGAHIVGAQATELIHELLLGRTAELLPEDIAETIHAHPTLSEAVMEAARAASYGASIHA